MSIKKKEFYRNIYSEKKCIGNVDNDDDNDYDEIELDNIDNVENCGEKEFEVLSSDKIVEYMLSIIKEVSSVTEIPGTTARILLNFFKWDKEKLLDKFFGSDQRKLFEEANVINPFFEKSCSFTNLSKSVSNGIEECYICFTEFDSSMMTGLECGHRFCTDCWAGYLTSKIRDEGESQTVHCAAISCKILVDDSTVMRLVKDPKVKLKYQQLITNSFIECNRLLKWCPSPGCGNVIKVQYAGVKPVTCNCNRTFCFRCGERWHDPVGCNIVEKWIISVDEAESRNWIASHAKKCPNCNVAIEKKGGCNHIKCLSCHYDFCWSCFKTWVRGGHGQCNRYDGVPQDVQEKSRADLKKYLFYWNRYNNHLESLRFEQKLYETVGVKMDEMYNFLDMSRNEVQFLKKAVDVLCSCRQTLMYTYVFAYYLQMSNQSMIFESNQNDLEIATESLSEYLERDITKENLSDIKQKVQDRSRYCDSRRKMLLEHVREGYDKKWWNCLME